MSENDPRPDDAATRIPPPSPHQRPDVPSGGDAGVYGGPASGGPGGYGTPSGGRTPAGAPRRGGRAGAPFGAPAYGAPPPPPPGTAPGRYGPPPPPASGRVRPRALWIVLAWIVAAVCTVVGVAGFAGGLYKSISDAAPSRTFQSGAPVPVALDPADKPILYASSSGPANVTCLVQDLTGHKAELTKPAFTQTVTADGRVWEGLFDIGILTAGSYTITCEAEEGKQVLFGISRSPAAGAVAIAGGVAALVLIPTAGFVFAIVTTVVVIVRRRRFRGRQASYGGAWPQGTPPGR